MSAPIQHTGTGAPVTTVVHDVKLVEEKIHQREEQHVQPVIERDILQKEVRQVIQPMHETTVLPTQRATGVLAGQDILINNDAVIAPQVVPEAQRIVGAVDVNVVQHAPIIEERFHKQVIEEVQPVLYRDVIQPKETILTQNIHERIIDAPVVYQETRSVIELTQPVHVVEPAVVPVVPVAAPVVVPVVAPVVPVVPVAAPAPVAAQAAFAVIPDGVPVVHDGKIVNAGVGGHDAGQVIRPVEAGLQTHGALPGTAAAAAHTTHGTTGTTAHHGLFAKKDNETAEERKARKLAQKEHRKQESADAKAARKAAKAQKNAAKRPHETAEQKKARKAAKKAGRGY